MGTVKRNSCIVCGKLCSGRVCRECYLRKSNKRHYSFGLRPTYISLSVKQLNSGGKKWIKSNKS